VTSDSSRLDWADAARGIAILMVVVFHSVQWLSLVFDQSGFWEAFTGALSTIRLPLFFTLSGVFATSWLNRSMRELLTRKIATLVWLYVLWQALTYLFFLAVPNLSSDETDRVRELLTALATPLWPQNSLWFLFALALFFVTSWLAARALPTWLILTVAALISTLSISGNIAVGNIGWDGSLQNYIFFACGAFARPAVERLGNLNKTWAGVTVLVWGSVYFALNAFDAVELVATNLVVRFLGIGAGIGLGVILARSTALRKLGSNTLALYLPHFIFIGGITWILSILGLDRSDLIMSTITPILVVAVVVVVALALHRVAMRCRFGRCLYALPSVFENRLRKRR
jgi:uncharacterized membrane protein YcfT